MSNSEAGTSNEQYKSSSSKKRNVSNYNKRHILNLLKEKNCHPKQLESMLARFRVDDENIIKGKLPQVINWSFRSFINLFVLNYRIC